MGYVIWTTSDCNLDCTYCYENHEKQKNHGSFDEDILLFFSTCMKEELKHISFHGGEPLLNYQLIKNIVDYCKKRKLETNFSFTTNGTQWNKEIESLLVDNQEAFKLGVSLSIDGTSKSHNMCRKDKKGNGTYDNVIKVKEGLLKLFPDLCARMTITPENVSSLYDNIKHLSGCGFRVISSVVDIFDERWDDELMQVFSNQYEKVIIYWLDNQYLELSLIDTLFRRRYGFCKLSYNIYTDGNIYPCTYVAGSPRFIIGNIKEGINNVRRQKCIENCRADYDYCKECAIKQSCIYNRCKYMNYIVHGNMERPSSIGCYVENIKVNLYNKYINELSH